MDDGDQSNNDFIDLSDFYTHIFELRADLADDGVLNQSVGDFSDNTALAGGSITFTGVVGSDLTFDNTNVACFVAGTRIKTARGLVDVYTLSEGDVVQTLDNGLKPVRAVLRTTVNGRGALAPIVFSKGTWGALRDLAVSSMHRMFVSDWRAELLFGDVEVLVPAARLVNGETIYRAPCDQVTYVHLVLDDHGIVLAEGVASESFQITEDALQDHKTAAELQALFPDLLPAQKHVVAKRCLRGFEAELLAQIA